MINLEASLILSASPLALFCIRAHLGCFQHLRKVFQGIASPRAAWSSTGSHVFHHQLIIHIIVTSGLAQDHPQDTQHVLESTVQMLPELSGCCWDHSLESLFQCLATLCCFPDIQTKSLLTQPHAVSLIPGHKSK